MDEFDYIELTCNTCRFYSNVKTKDGDDWYCAVSGKCLPIPIEICGTLDKECPIADKPSIGSMLLTYTVVK